MMTLDELSDLVQTIKNYPEEDIQEINDEIQRLTTLVKYTRHSKKLESHAKKLKILEDFIVIHSVFIKKDEKIILFNEE